MRIVRSAGTTPPMPRRDIDRLQGEIEELFADLWQVPRFARPRQGFRPQVDCYRTDDPPELDGRRRARRASTRPSIEIAVARARADGRGPRERPRAPGHVYQQMEIDYGPFERQVALRRRVDPAGASATYERGLLHDHAAGRAARPRPPPIAIVRSVSVAPSPGDAAEPAEVNRSLDAPEPAGCRETPSLCPSCR